MECNGSLKRRTTVQQHRNKPQKSRGPDDRICHCSKHPYGALVHRGTRRRHIRNDFQDGIPFEIPAGNLYPDDLISNTVDLGQIEAIREATRVADDLLIEDDVDGEATDDNNLEDSDSDEDDFTDEDPDTVNEEEEMDELESSAPGRDDQLLGSSLGFEYPSC
jgi:hypothetical protein